MFGSKKTGHGFGGNPEAYGDLAKAENEKKNKHKEDPKNKHFFVCLLET